MATAPDYSAYYSNHLVAVHQGTAEYAQTPPFHPAIPYPEYDQRLGMGFEPNAGYDGVRNALHLLGLDGSRFGQPDWNPLGSIISPGQTVVIKPNFVLSSHYRGGNLFSIITHPSVLRAVVDYTFKALNGAGQIVIADTPQMDCDFQELLERTQLPAVQELYWSKYHFEIPIRDLRQFWFKYENENYLASQEKRRPLPGDPLGNILINLGEKSAFSGIESKNFYGADFNRSETVEHHSGIKQEYLLSRTMLSADVLISVPKLKVHKKVGVTLNAKGFVGSVTNKNFLIHYTLGSPEKGGDQFPDDVLNRKAKTIVAVQRYLYDKLLTRNNAALNTVMQAFYLPYRKFLKPLLKKTTETIVLYDGGNWHGNDSAWRMVVDLVNIMMYADTDGKMHSTPQRKIFSIVDGIIGGEGNGPLFPDERQTGVILAGQNLLAVDMSGARLMGFDPGKLKWARHLLESKEAVCFMKATNEIRVASNKKEYETLFQSKDRLLTFRPHPGWSGHIEI